MWTQVCPRITRMERIFFFALRAEILWKSFWESLEPVGSEINSQTEHWEFNRELSRVCTIFSGWKFVCKSVVGWKLKDESSLQNLHEVPEHLWSARKRHCVPSGELKVLCQGKASLRVERKDEKEKRVLSRCAYLMNIKNNKCHYFGHFPYTLIFATSISLR